MMNEGAPGASPISVLPRADVPGTGITPRGRHRDQTRDDALRQATIEILVESGYDRLTIDAVAARARAGKATVYRRWSSKAELVVDAVTHRDPMVQGPDTGSLRGDFEALLFGLHDQKDQEFRTRLLSGLVPAVLQSAELRVALQEAVNPLAMFDAVFARAVERGEIAAPKNPDLISALLPALALFQMIVFGENPTPEFAMTVIDEIVIPLLQLPSE